MRALVCTALLVLAPLGARAQDGAVLLVDPDPELRAAVHAVLAPWGTEVRGAEGDPGATMPGSAERGRALAARESAAAVVWISESDDGFALWVYDAPRDRVLTRRLERGPPFDEATAAAVALTIKTFLRHAAVAPPSERASGAEGARELRLAVALGLRALASEQEEVAPRAGLVLAFHPDALDGVLGIGLIAQTGTGIEVSGDSFAGRWHDVSVALLVRARARLGSMVDLGARLELGASIGWLDGVVLGPNRAATDVRVDPSLAALGEAGLWVAPGLRLALGAGVALVPTSRDYLVRGEPVLRLGPAALRAEILIEIPLG